MSTLILERAYKRFKRSKNNKTATKKRIKKLDEVEKVGGKIIVAYISDVEKSGDSYIKAAGSDAFIKLKEALYPSENKL